MVALPGHVHVQTAAIIAERVLQGCARWESCCRRDPAVSLSASSSRANCSCVYQKKNSREQERPAGATGDLFASAGIWARAGKLPVAPPLGLRLGEAQQW